MAETVADDLLADFHTACEALTEARLLVWHKDNPANRQALVEAEAGMDAVLDMWLETRRGSAVRAG